MYQEYDLNQTPMYLDNVPDQMKPIAYKHSRNQNFDILLNKFLNQVELTDIQLQQLNEHQKIILEEVKKKTQKKTKRSDQYQKLFFKKAFKYAQNAYFKKNKKNRSRRMSQFYHHHFDSVMKSLNIPITNFYHPDKKTKPGLTTGQKSFNSAYVKTILKSPSFRKVCIEYHEKFKQDCRQQRNKKISTFTGSLFSIMEKSKQDRTKLIKFLQSSKCKIPWCDRDIEEAYKRAGEQLDDYSLGEDRNSQEDEKKEQQEKKIDSKGQRGLKLVLSNVQPTQLNGLDLNGEYENHRTISHENQQLLNDQNTYSYHFHNEIELLHYQQQVDRSKKFSIFNEEQFIDDALDNSFDNSEFESQNKSLLRQAIDQMQI